MNARGFTVIELLIVLAILGILAALVARMSNRDSVSIDLAQWTCEKQEERSYHYTTLAGKVLITNTGRRMECVLWRRHAD